MKKTPTFRLANLPLEGFEQKALSDPNSMRQMLFDGRKGKDGVEMPKEGGYLSWFEGAKYPYKGIMVSEPLRRISILKRALLETTVLLMSKPIRYFLPVAIFLPKRMLRQMMITGIKSFASLSYVALGDYYLKPLRFCKSGREIYKVGTEVMEKSFPEINILTRMRSLKGFCMLWDFDPAYRYQGQDIFGELNKEALKKNLAKELTRLFDIMIERQDKGDVARTMQKKWGRFKIVIAFLARKGLLKEFVEILLNLDIEKVKLDEGDVYNFAVFPHYNLRGLPYQERLELREGMEHN